METEPSTCTSLTSEHRTHTVLSKMGFSYREKSTNTLTDALMSLYHLPERNSAAQTT